MRAGDSDGTVTLGRRMKVAMVQNGLQVFSLCHASIKIDLSL